MKTCVVVAGGPSLTLAQVRAIGIAKQRDPSLLVIAVNDAVYPCWFADACYACDAEWWRFHKGLPGFNGVKYSLALGDGSGARNLNGYADVVMFRSAGVTGLREKDDEISNGRNSGYQAVHVAYHHGAKKIILVAFDMKNVVTHWFGKHPQPIRRIPRSVNWVNHMDSLCSELRGKGVQVLNATAGSAIRTLPFVDLAEELGVSLG